MVGLLSLSLAVLTASATTVTIQNADIASSSESTAAVSIMINDVIGVKGAHILLEYDSSVVHVIDIGNSDFAMVSYEEINNERGFVRYAVFNHLDALSGDITLAEVTLKRISAGSAPLDLTVVALNNGSAEIPRDVISGLLTITGEVTPTYHTAAETPTAAPTPPQAQTTPTPVSTAAPTPPQAQTTPTPVSTAAPTPPQAQTTPTPEEPGFEAIFTLASLLAIAYLALRRKQE
jgi:PGF-CTERM protein